MLKVNEEAIKRLKKKGKCVLIAGMVGASLILTGCEAR